MKNKMSISVILTAFREERTIGKALNELRNQLPKNPEILVISPDNPTISEARKIAKLDKRIRILRDPGEGKPTALNIGFKKVRGKILILTDGDVIIGENSIKFLLKHFGDPRVGAVSSKVVYQISKNSLFYEWAKLSEKVF